MALPWGATGDHGIPVGCHGIMMVAHGMGHGVVMIDRGIATDDYGRP